MEDIKQNSHTDNQLETVVCYMIIEEDPSVNSDTVWCEQVIEESPCVNSDTVRREMAIEEGPHVTESEPEETPQIVEKGSRLTETETEETPQIAKEGPRLCPLCSSEIKYFFVNFTEKLLMCENGECEFPFGYEDLQFKKFEFADDCEMISIQNVGSQYSDSLNSSATRLGIVKTNNVACEDKLNHQFLVPKSVKQNSPKEKMRKRKKSEIKRNLEYLEKSNMHLHEREKRKSLIGNPKWINNLKKLQDSSGVVLLQPEELKSISVKKNNEVKLDIERGDGNNVCSIKILMAPPSTSNA